MLHHRIKLLSNIRKAYSVSAVTLIAAVFCFGGAFAADAITDAGTPVPSKPVSITDPSL